MFCFQKKENVPNCVVQHQPLPRLSCEYFNRLTHAWNTGLSTLGKTHCSWIASCCILSRGLQLEVLKFWVFLVILTITETPLKLKYQPASKASLQECKCSVPFCLFTSVEGIGVSEVVAWLLHPLETASPPACPQLLQRRGMSL